MKRLLFICLFAVITRSYASAQVPCAAEAQQNFSIGMVSCPTSSATWNTFNTPLIDGNARLNYGDPDNNIVSLYGSYGNTENTGAALAHYNDGIAQANR